MQELGGPNGNWTSGATPRTFGVLGGRVDLNKPDGVASVAQQNVTIGDGTQVGVARPELRLLQSNQIDVRAYDAPTGTETNVMTLNSGIFNVNGMTETVGSAIVTGAGTSTIDLGTGGNLRFDTGLTVDLGATGEVVSTDHRALNVAGTLTVNGRVDLKDNKLVVVAGDLGSWNGSAYTGVTGLIQTGRATGDWSGNGIVTSETEATTGVLTGLAVANAEDVGKAGGTFGGQSVNTGDVLVMYTWGGDAQMDGDLDGDDYFQIDSNVAQSGSVFGYSKGDFNLDGLINGDDYFIIDSNIAFAQTQPNWPTGAGVAGVAAVPEPASMGVLALAASALMRRRRRA